MDLEILRLVARSLGASITSTARPALTFLAVQLSVGLLVRLDYASVPSTFAWLISIPAIAVAGMLTGLELMAHHDGHVAEVLRHLKVEPLLGAFGAFSSCLLFMALGLPEEEAMALIPAEQLSELASATHHVAVADAGLASKLIVLAASVGLNLGLGWLRGVVLDWLAQFELHRVWARLESGGVLIALVLLVFLPIIALALIALFALSVAGLGLAIHATKRLLDRRCRVACAHCAHLVRPEARLCPKCRGEVQPVRILEQGLPLRGRLKAALATRRLPWRVPDLAAPNT